MDFPTSDASPDDRQTVTFDNHVRKGAMRTLSFTKTLYDVEGKKIDSDPNNPVFDFRLSLGSENDNDSELTLANMQTYYVKDKKGNYCRWDSSTGTFISIGKTDYTKLTDAQKKQAAFHTSINGAISHIPVDYTVEVRDLLIDSKFNVTERDYEVPDGYSWRQYLLNGEEVSGAAQNAGVTGAIPEDTDASDPRVEIQNYKGWGITVNKVWTDKDFMDSHDAIYFAVYTKDKTTGELTLVENTLRQMGTGTTSLYWYFDRLSNNASFDDHVIREVKITNGTPIVDDNGFVTNAGAESLTFEPVGDNDGISVKATPTVNQMEESFDYTVTYQQGDVSETDDNIRLDTVTNSRPGIRIVKTAWNGSTPLAGAVFTLKMQQGGAEKDVGRASYTSNADGLATIAYLPAGEGTFTLTETKSPAGYAGLTGAVTITKAADGTITISGQEADSLAYSYTAATDTSDDEVITIRNKPFELKAVKVDASNETPLEGVQFALYRQVKSSGGEMIRDYYPMDGYTDLVSGADGVIPGVTQELIPGTYYLHETKALDAYKPIETDICFTISETGVVTMMDGDLEDRTFASEEDQDGEVTYTITVRNAEAWQKLQIQKVDIADTDRTLQDAKFDLYKVGTDGNRSERALYTELTSNSEGMLVYTKDDGTGVTLDLPVGVYHLVETSAPAGYNIKAQPVVITVTSTNVTYDEGTTLSQSGSGRSYDPETKVYTLIVSNSAGYELPSTGGPGTRRFTISGSILILGAGVMLWMRRRRLHHHY